MEIKYNSWDKINIRIFNKLESILNDNEMSEVDKNSFLLSVLCDCSVDEIENLQYSEYVRLNEESNFIKNPPAIEVRTEYNINGTKYNLDLNYKNYTASQYIDFQNLTKDSGYVANKHKIIAIFLIPDGCTEYCKGYDVDKVAADVLEYMPILDADACMLFFSIVYNALTTATLNYFKRKAKKQMRKERRGKRKTLLKKGVQEIDRVLHLLKGMPG